MSGIIMGNSAAIGVITQSIDVASVAANTTAEQTFTVPGLAVGDFVIVNKPSASAGLGICNARVSAANTLAITFNNNTASPIDPAAESYKIMYIRPDSTLTGVAF